MTKFQKELKERFDIKSVKTMNGRDGLAINCSIYFDKKRIATYKHSGNGGEGSTTPIPIKNDRSVNRAKLTELETLISKLPKIPSDFSGRPLTADLDIVVEELMEIKTIEKLMSKGIVVAIPSKSDVFGLNLPKDEYLTYKYKINLDKIPPINLKRQVEKIKKGLKKGEIIFNTNLPK